MLILLVGLAVAMALGPASPPASSGPSPTVSAAATTPPPSESPSPVASASPSSEPSSSVLPASAEPSASGETGNTATIRGLKLDGADDPAGQDRQITFRTNGPAAVSMRLVVVAPNAVDACLAVNAVQLYCTSGHSFTMTGETSRSNATWTLSLRGQHAETPKLDVTLEFPAAEPTLTIDGAWFDGAARPDYNGVVIELKPSTGSPVSIDAAWEGNQPWRFTITPPTGSALEYEGTGSAVQQTVALEGELHSFELVNTGAGAERIPLTMTIAWR